MNTKLSTLGPIHEPVSRWESLSPGDNIEVWSSDTFQYTGRVDQIGNQAQVIWVIENGTAHRRLFLRDDNVTFFKTAPRTRSKE